MLLREFILSSMSKLGLNPDGMISVLTAVAVIADISLTTGFLKVSLSCLLLLFTEPLCDESERLEELPFFSKSLLRLDARLSGMTSISVS